MKATAKQEEVNEFGRLLKEHNILENLLFRVDRFKNLKDVSTIKIQEETRRKKSSQHPKKQLIAICFELAAGNMENYILLYCCL
jgi:hypothetical protein